MYQYCLSGYFLCISLNYCAIIATAHIVNRPLVALFLCYTACIMCIYPITAIVQICTWVLNAHKRANLHTLASSYNLRMCARYNTHANFVGLIYPSTISILIKR